MTLVATQYTDGGVTWQVNKYTSSDTFVVPAGVTSV